MSRKPDRDQDYQTLLEAHTFEVNRAQKAEARWKRAKWFAEGQRGTQPDWRCLTCGCLWRDNADDSVSLYNAEAKSCASCEGSTIMECKPLTVLALLTRLEYLDGDL